MALTFTKIILTLQLQTNIRSPYLFFNLKNQFEGAFRRSVDCSRTSCSGCGRDQLCPYAEIFSQALAEDPVALKKYQKPSLPFAFQFPLIPGLPNRGAIVAVEIILVGSAARYHRQFIDAVSLVYSDVAVPVKAESTDYLGNRYLLMDETGATYEDHLFLFSAEELRNSRRLSGSIDVRFLTPLLLLRQGHPLRELNFSVFVRPLLRRVSSLVYYYGGDEIDCDFKWLAEQSSRVETVESELSWSEWRNGAAGAGIAGITGRAVFAGDMEAFSQFLLLGQYFNLGKAASFGRGRYLID